MKPNHDTALDGGAAEDVPVRALLIDRHAQMVRSAHPGHGFGYMVARGVIRNSLDRLRRCGIRIGVVDADRMAPWPPPYRVLESILGPVDVWCGSERSRLRAGAPVTVGADGQIIVTAAIALGLDPRACAVVTDDPNLVEAADRAGSVPVFHSADGSRLRSTHAAIALSEAVDQLVAQFTLSGHGSSHSGLVSVIDTAGISLPA